MARWLGRWPRRATGTLAGVLLAIGAPLGLLFLRLLPQAPTLARVREELLQDPWTYAYVFGSTVLAFACFGFALGRQMDLLVELSLTDPLTSLGNRRRLQECLEAELGPLRHSVSLLLVDLDGLKEINDQRGHRTGDAALQRVAFAIRRELRAHDVAARMGGDEFAVLVPNTERDAAASLAERIRQRVSGVADASIGALTVSIGVASAARAAQAPSASGLLRGADAALYAAKRAGRNRVAVAEG